MKTDTIGGHIKQIYDWGSHSNEAQLKIFSIIYYVEKSGVWLKSSYYNDHQDLIKYKDASFKDLVTDVFKFGYVRYTHMKSMISEVQNWEELYLKHGWDRNMACFVKRTKEEQDYVLQQINSGDTRDMQIIWREKYPKKPEKVSKMEDGWKIKYNELKKKYSNLERENLLLKAHLRNITQITNVVNL